MVDHLDLRGSGSSPPARTLYAAVVTDLSSSASISAATSLPRAPSILRMRPSGSGSLAAACRIPSGSSRVVCFRDVHVEQRLIDALVSHPRLQPPRVHADSAAWSAPSGRELRLLSSRGRSGVRGVQDIHTVIIGGGVVGLASAAVLARRGETVAVLERNRKVGQETSSRNSGVIHAGLYYPTASLKAELCITGRERVYARCARDGVPHRPCG
jgi:hypothetical protein